MAFTSSRAATAGTVTSISSFTVPESPSGMYYYAAQDLIYVLCGTSTNADHSLYAFTTGGVQRCKITIPAAAKMSRVDGFQIVGTTAYIVDSQGPIHASTHLGGSMYAVTWTNPCGCTATGTCTSSSVTWSPTVTKKYTLTASQSNIADGGGVDTYFRNSGVAVVGDSFFGVDGVHPVTSSLACCYPKSVVKVPLSGDGSAVTQKWSFTGSTIGRDVDMEGLTCGADNCANFLYIGDEYNYIYKLNLATADAAAATVTEWDLRSIVGSVPSDKGIEALTYASSTGYFYAGIQETSKVHVVQLTEPGATPGPTTTPTATPTATPPSSPSSARVMSVVVAIATALLVSLAVC